MARPGLIADIGGTNARFAIVPVGGTEALHAETLPCADYAGPAEAAEAYLAKLALPEPPARGAFAVACPILGDAVSMTNHVWRFSIEEVRTRLGLDTLKVVNDFIAVALAVPLLTKADCVAVGGSTPVEGSPIAVMGPGTGLGVSALIPKDGDWIALPAEGGHITMAAANDRESEIIGWLRRHYGHVSAERVLSGPGLANLHRALRGLAGLPDDPLTPAEVSKLAEDGDPLAVEALDIFFRMLGTVAGNLALILGARGGVVLAGGILPKVQQRFLHSGFRRRFEEKGRFNDYLAPIPVSLITHPYPAFLGLAGLVR